MQRWEYLEIRTVHEDQNLRVLRVNGRDVFSGEKGGIFGNKNIRLYLYDYLKKIGLQGWEIVSMSMDSAVISGSPILIAKRPIDVENVDPSELLDSILAG